jgi:hypothetical protein
VWRDPTLGAGGRWFKSNRPDQYPLQHQQILEAATAGFPILGPIWIQLAAIPVSLLPTVGLLSANAGKPVG